MEAFEPPKYIASLIAAVNDGAKSAQTGALAFTLVGLYLLATAFSTTDEDLLLQHTVPVSQIGVQVPVVFSFALAPLVLLFLHVYTLIRYDMLAANLRRFRVDIQAMVPLEVDRERCRQLLANVEFVQMRTAPRGSPLHSSLYRLVALLVLAGFPVVTLIAIQISSLRYQSDTIIKVQQACIALDLALLLWFFLRHRRRGNLPEDPFRLGWVWYLLACFPLVLILILDPLYLNVPGSDNGTVRAGDDGPKWNEAHKQPLDLGLCPTLHWGCRYLTVDHRTLVGHVWKPEAIADLRAALFGKKVNVKESLAAIEGVVLRDRSLRFAKFDESRLYAADMIESDLSHATFERAQLQGANLPRAHLSGAHLSGVNLSGADLRRTDLSDAKLSDADLSSADLSSADLSNANLSSADLSGANLSSAYLNGAHLRIADLSGTDLSDAKLSGADLIAAKLSGADLRHAFLFGANLGNTDLSGAKNLTQAQLNQACGSGRPMALPEGVKFLDKPCPEKPVAPPLNPKATP